MMTRIQEQKKPVMRHEVQKEGPKEPLIDQEVHKRVSALACSWFKQIITLATGAIVLSITFVNDVVKDTIASPQLLEWSWCLFAIAVLIGLFLHGSMVGQLWKHQRADVYGRRQFGSFLQMATFFAGLILFVLFAARNFPSTPTMPQIPSNIELQLPRQSRATLKLDKGARYNLRQEKNQIIVEVR